MLREILYENNLLSYGEWKKASDNLNSQVDGFSDRLNTFPRGEMGLTPDDVQNSKEYKLAKQNYNNAFKKLQNFNKKSSKEFLRRESKERRANRGK